MAQIQDQDEPSQTSIEDLPSEMLGKVFKNLEVSSLLSCRPTCRKWNDMANHILHDRPETELSFSFNLIKKQYQLKLKNEGGLNKKEKSLQDFIDCISLDSFEPNMEKKSKSSPFARFALINIPKWDESINNFFSLVKETVTCLKLSFSQTAVKQPGLSEKLRGLLLEETPALKELGLEFDEVPDNSWFGFEFPSLGKLEREAKDLKLSLFLLSTLSKDGESSSKKLQLKVLHVGRNFKSDTNCGIYRDVLKISPHLERIECISNSNDFSTFFGLFPRFNQEDFAFLLECGKLHALKNVEFDPNSEFLSSWKNAVVKIHGNCSSSSADAAALKLKLSNLFKVEKLQLSLRKIYMESASRAQTGAGIGTEWQDALELTEQIFEGSKDTLENLSLWNCTGFPSGFSFPTFTKLSTIDFTGEVGATVTTPLFPPGCRSLEIFPCVKTLHLGQFSNRLKLFFPQEDSIPLMSKVHTVTFQGVETNGEDVEKLSLLCPNLKTLTQIYIGKAGLLDFPSCGRAVWHHMKNLETLDLRIDADAEANAFPALDSTLTGMSKENCLRLFNQSNDSDIQTLDMDDESNSSAGEELRKRRESELKGLKVEESVMDLSKLKELSITIQSTFPDEFIEFMGDYQSAYESAVADASALLSRVSHLYALKLMPGLKYKIESDADNI